MTLLDQATTANALAGEFAGPLRAAVLTAAVNVMAEDPTAPLHEERTHLAMMALRSPGSITDTFAWAVSTNATVVQKWVDGDHEGAYGDLSFVISSIWDALARSWAGVA